MRSGSLSYVLIAGSILGMWGAGAFGQEGAAPANPEDAEAHHAQGEVWYNEAWHPIAEIFAGYRETRGQIEELGQKTAAERQGQMELNGQIAQIRKESEAKEQEVRIELAKARSKRDEARKALRERPPDEPKYQSLPPRPRRSQYLDQDDYENALDRWKRECDRIKQENDRLKRQYERDLAAFQKRQEEAEKDLKKAEENIKEIEGRIEALQKELEEKEKPFVEKLRAIGDRVEALEREARALQTRVEAMAEAMRTVPQRVRLRQGIVEWEGAFHPLEELQALYEEIQTEIHRVREELKAQAEKAGRDFPEDWRHPEQDRMDALMALLDEAEAARADKTEAAPADETEAAPAEP